MRRAEPVQRVGRERALREFAQQIAQKSDRLRRFIRRRVALSKRVIGLFQQAVQVIPPRQGIRLPGVCGGQKFFKRLRRFGKIAERQMALAEPEQADRIRRARRKAAQQFEIIAGGFADIIGMPCAFRLIELGKLAVRTRRKFGRDFRERGKRRIVCPQLKMAEAQMIERAVALRIRRKAVGNLLKHLDGLAIRLLLEVQQPQLIINIGIIRLFLQRGEQFLHRQFRLPLLKIRQPFLVVIRTARQQQRENNRCPIICLFSEEFHHTFSRFIEPCEKCENKFA